MYKYYRMHKKAKLFLSGIDFSYSIDFTFNELTFDLFFFSSNNAFVFIQKN